MNCYKNPKGYYLDKNDFIYKKCYHRCELCEIKGNDMNHNCLKCNFNYRFNITYNNSYMNCYENCSYYYYLDINNNFYCTTNYSCPLEYSKLIPDKMKCVNDCSYDDIYINEINNICYKEIPDNISSTNIYTEIYHNFSTDIYTEVKTDINTILSTDVYKIGRISSYNIIEKQIIDNDKTIKISDKSLIEIHCDGEKSSFLIKLYDCNQNYLINDIINNICKIKNKSDEIKNINSNEEYIKHMDLLLKNIELCFISSKYDDSNIDNGIDEIIIIDKIKMTLTTSENQKNNKDKNITLVDLGDCENELRNHYNITDEKLYMKKIDVIEEGMKIPKIEYDIYSKLDGMNLTKLNISVCENIKITLSIPITLSENIDKLNISSRYYNDICYPTTSNKGTDIILKDRKNEFIDNNKTICQEDCDFSEYDNNNQKAKCLCDVKESSNSIIDMKINKTKLYENFLNIKNFMNINILKCYKTLFTYEGLVYNIGSYITLSIILFHIICIFVFAINQVKILIIKIRDILINIKNNQVVKLDNKEENKEQKINNNQGNKDKINLSDERMTKKKNVLTKTINTDNIRLNKRKRKKNKRKNVPPKRKINIVNNFNSSENIYKVNYDIININKIKNKMNESQSSKNTINFYQKNKNNHNKDSLMEYSDDELNMLPYDLAIEYDKRNYWGYYLSLIKTKHNFIFSFFYDGDYNSKIIKIDLFIFSFTIFYTVNALFFTDDTMHEIYKNKGSFDLEYQLPKIIYSSLISIILNILLKYLALSNNAILDFKRNKSLNDIYKREINLKKKLKIKFILFFVISFIFLLFFWYYLSMFCAIYRNTQYHLIKDTLISFGLSLTYPFIIYLFPGFFRIPALINKNNRQIYKYNFSKILQML